MTLDIEERQVGTAALPPELLEAARKEPAVAAPTPRRSPAWVLLLLVAANVALLGTVLLGLGALPAIAAALLVVLAIVWAVAIPRGARLEGLAQIFVVLIYANVLVVASLIHGVPEPVLAASYVLLLIPVFGYLVRGEPVVFTAALPWVVAYGGVLILSGAFADRPTNTIPYVLNFLVEGLLLYVLITNAFRTTGALQRVVWVLIGSAVVMSALTLHQELTQSYDSNYFGFAQITEQVFSLGENYDGFVLRGRLSGPVGEPNRYAQVLIVVLPLALVQAVRGPNRTGRMVAAGSSAVILAGTLLTFSRGAVVALAVIGVGMVALRLVRARHVIGLLLGFTLVLVLFTPDYAVRLRSLAGVGGFFVEGLDTPDAAVLGRATSNLASWNVFLDYPVLGVGPLQYFERYSQDYANELGLRWFEGRRRAHNLYSELAADTGILGVITFLAVPLVTVRRLRRTARRLEDDKPDLAALADAMVLMIVGYFLTATFLHLSYQRYLWLLLGLAGAASWVLAREAAPEDEPPRRTRSGAPRRSPRSPVAAGQT